MRDKPHFDILPTKASPHVFVPSQIYLKRLRWNGEVRVGLICADKPEQI